MSFQRAHHNYFNTTTAEATTIIALGSTGETSLQHPFLCSPISTSSPPAMNDLFSSTSFKKYTDLKRQVVIDIELESGTSCPPANLDAFFAEVEAIKEDLVELERLRKHLQESNEETKTAHNTKAVKAARAQMDRDVEQVLRRAKLVKGKLEELHQSNASHRKLPGCGPGSSADRTRTSVVTGLGKKLKDIMDDFQTLRNRISVEYKEAIQRRYLTVTGQQADEETIERLISSGESETFLQKAIQEQGRGQVMDTISEIQERRDAVKEMEKNLMDLHQVFLDMAALVEAQGQHLNDIESHVAHASSFVRRGTEELVVAKDIQRSSRRCMCIAIILGVVLVVVIVIPVLSVIIPK